MKMIEPYFSFLKHKNYTSTWYFFQEHTLFIREKGRNTALVVFDYFLGLKVNFLIYDVTGNVMKVRSDRLLKAVQRGEIGDGGRLMAVGAKALKYVSIIDEAAKPQSPVLVLVFADGTNESTFCLV